MEEGEEGGGGEEGWNELGTMRIVRVVLALYLVECGVSTRELLVRLIILFASLCLSSAVSYSREHFPSGDLRLQTLQNLIV